MPRYKPLPMKSRYEAAEAERFCQQYGAYGRDLAMRVYTSRLLGSDPALVLHGGGNTSVKATAHDLYGDSVEVLCVKGSGWDLASIEPAGFPACRLAPLRRACQLERMTDEEMVAELRRQLMDPASPNPSVEALLHAYLPAKFVDHTHADAVLAVVDQADAEQRCHSIFGDDVLFVPYVMPGFVLARRVAQLWDGFKSARRREPTAMILDKHGIFSWGETAQESYERMIALVTRAEQALPAAAAPSDGPTELDDERRSVALAFRGALARATERGWIAHWRSAPKMAHFTRRADLAKVSQQGCATPDHVIRTKRSPLILGDRQPDEALASYAKSYDEYVERCARERHVTVKKLDSLPRVVLVRDLGVLCLGKSKSDAMIVGDIYEHTVEIIEAASALGEYRPVGELDLFDVEYWSLEQAKLALKKQAAGALEGKVALVTGAASGIGLATSRALLAAGAHVVVTDRDERVLDAVSEWPQEKYPDRFVARVCDVTKERDCRAAVAAACDAFGGLDVLVSNAGTAPSGLLHEASGDTALRRSLEENLLSHQQMARAAAQAMIAQGCGGVLLFNASKSAFNPGAEFGPYAIPKAAVVALMRQYAIDLGAHGIRANAINADRVRTKLFDEGVLEARARARGLSPSEYFRANLLSRETTAEHVAEAFVFLASAEATTGCVITVDGGNPAAFPR